MHNSFSAQDMSAPLPSIQKSQFEALDGSHPPGCPLQTCYWPGKAAAKVKRSGKGAQAKQYDVSICFKHLGSFQFISLSIHNPLSTFEHQLKVSLKISAKTTKTET